MRARARASWAKSSRIITPELPAGPDARNAGSPVSDGLIGAEELQALPSRAVVLESLLREDVLFPLLIREFHDAPDHIGIGEGMKRSSVPQGFG